MHARHSSDEAPAVVCDVHREKRKVVMNRWEAFPGHFPSMLLILSLCKLFIHIISPLCCIPTEDLHLAGTRQSRPPCFRLASLSPSPHTYLPLLIFCFPESTAALREKGSQLHACTPNIGRARCMNRYMAVAQQRTFAIFGCKLEDTATLSAARCYCHDSTLSK